MGRRRKKRLTSMGCSRTSSGGPWGALPFGNGFIWITVAVGAAALSAALPASAGVRIVSEGVTVDRSAGSARFWLRLDGRPDFDTVDDLGRPVDSFQYEVDGDWAGGLVSFPFREVDAVVRGDELRGGRELTLPIRSAGPDFQPDPDPRSGGWGPVVTEVALDLDGTELSFDAALADLGDDDGVFAYRVFTTESGATISFIESSTIPPVTAVPLPAAVWPALATATALVVMQWKRRKPA
jgi:hypothetical protein